MDGWMGAWNRCYFQPFAVHQWGIRWMVYPWKSYWNGWSRGTPRYMYNSAGWFIMEHPIRIDDLGAFRGTTILGTLHMWDDPQPARWPFVSWFQSVETQFETRTVAGEWVLIPPTCGNFIGFDPSPELKQTSFSIQIIQLWLSHRISEKMQFQDAEGKQVAPRFQKATHLHFANRTIPWREVALSKKNRQKTA